MEPLDGKNLIFIPPACYNVDYAAVLLKNYKITGDWHMNQKVCILLVSILVTGGAMSVYSEESNAIVFFSYDPEISIEDLNNSSFQDLEGRVKTGFSFNLDRVVKFDKNQVKFYFNRSDPDLESFKDFIKKILANPNNSLDFYFSIILNDIIFINGHNRAIPFRAEYDSKENAPCIIINLQETDSLISFQIIELDTLFGVANEASFSEKFPQYDFESLSEYFLLQQIMLE